MQHVHWKQRETWAEKPFFVILEDMQTDFLIYEGFCRTGRNMEQRWVLTGARKPEKPALEESQTFPNKYLLGFIWHAYIFLDHLQETFEAWNIIIS